MTAREIVEATAWAIYANTHACTIAEAKVSVEKQPDPEMRKRYVERDVERARAAILAALPGIVERLVIAARPIHWIAGENVQAEAERLAAELREEAKP